MKFIEAAGQWADYRRRMVQLELVQGSTFRNQSYIAMQLMNQLAEHDLRDIRKSHIELYIGERLKTCQPVTVAGEVNVLRQILNWCVDEQLLETRPRLPSVSVPNVERQLPPDEAYTFVLKNVAPAHSSSLEFMLLTGLSPHEVERIEKRDLHIRTGPDAEQCPYEVHIGFRDDFNVKTPARKRVVILNKTASQIILIRSLGTVPTHKPFPTRDSTEKAIQRMRQQLHGVPAGVERITPKMMRQWFASKISGDVAENVLQALLGHAPGSKVTRMHYVRSNEAQRADAVSALKMP